MSERRYGEIDQNSSPQATIRQTPTEMALASGRAVVAKDGDDWLLQWTINKNKPLRVPPVGDPDGPIDAAYRHAMLIRQDEGEQCIYVGVHLAGNMSLRGTTTSTGAGPTAEWVLGLRCSDHAALMLWAGKRLGVREWRRWGDGVMVEVPDA